MPWMVISEFGWTLITLTGDPLSGIMKSSAVNHLMFTESRIVIGATEKSSIKAPSFATIFPFLITALISKDSNEGNTIKSAL